MMMKMTMTQFREWVAATEFSAEQGAELGGETHKAVGHTDDIDIDTKDLEEAVELIILINNDAPDIRFQGELIAEASSDSNVSWSSGTGGRWTELKLYRTAGGRYVAQSIGRTKWQGEHTRYSAKVCETAADVIAFFGHGWLAKELYDDADIEDVQHVE